MDQDGRGTQKGTEAIHHSPRQLRRHNLRGFAGRGGGRQHLQRCRCGSDDEDVWQDSGREALVWRACRPWTAGHLATQNHRQKRGHQGAMHRQNHHQQRHHLPPPCRAGGGPEQGIAKGDKLRNKRTET